MQKYSWCFIIFTSLFITCLISANIIAVKLINIFNFTLPAAIIIFPISYIIGDVLTEVYGYKSAKRVIWLGFFCNSIFVISIYLGQILPGSLFWDGQIAYNRILGYTPRILIASFLAYLIGEFSNSVILSKMKIATQGKFLWARTIFSTLVGEGLDSITFIFFAFAGTISRDGLINTILMQWFVKSLYEIIATPITYKVVNSLKRIEMIDVFDKYTDFSPFNLKK